MAANRVFLALLGTLAWPNVAGSSPLLFITSIPSTSLVPSSSQTLLSVGGGPALGGALGVCTPVSAARLPCARRRRAPMSLTMVDAKKDYYAVGAIRFPHGSCESRSKTCAAAPPRPTACIVPKI
jgi:hypothetical protein